MNEIAYTTVNDVQIPDLTLPETEPISQYGRMRQKYLRENRPVKWNHLVLTGMLYEHLSEIETAAQSRIDLMLPKFAEAAGATEASLARAEELLEGYDRTLGCIARDARLQKQLEVIAQNAQALARIPAAAPQAGAILRAVQEIKE